MTDTRPHRPASPAERAGLILIALGVVVGASSWYWRQFQYEDRDFSGLSYTVSYPMANRVLGIGVALVVAGVASWLIGRATRR